MLSKIVWGGALIYLGFYLGKKGVITDDKVNSLVAENDKLLTQIQAALKTS